MPGMLVERYDGVNDIGSSERFNKENNLNGSTTLKRQFNQIDGAVDEQARRNDEPPSKRQMINGSTTPTMNGILTNGDHHRHSPEVDEPALRDTTSAEIPPELYHVQDNVVPLSVIWERMAQEAHIELEELIADLSNMPAPLINGYTNPRNDVNMDKKNRIWDFAHKWRAKFIQLGVLTTWSTNAEAVGKLIDLSFWLTGQRTHHREFVRWMGELKRQLSFDSLPAPDLKTALEVLATGKAQWISDLCYIPEKSLTPAELLKSLRTLNTILTIRLTTQQDIPYHLSKWTVKDGRVIFHVQNEFELDLAVASEDPTSQFFFIDLRFLFSPSSKRLSTGYTKRELELKINEILGREGLPSCYEFLHELVLEHKLTTLRDQARKMIKGQWNDNARICASNRGIVIQYWTNKPGKKNWIEIAVNSGKTKGAPTTGLETSVLDLRWHRHGMDVKNHGIEIDGGHLSMERILNEVIARHTNHIFKETKRMLKQSPIYSGKRLSIKHRAHLFDARDCSLTVQLSKSKSVAISQDAVTGMLGINPVSQSNWNTMMLANNSPDPAVQLSSQLGILRCSTVLEEAVFEAKKFGWQAESVEHLTKETKIRLFKSEKIKYQFFHISNWPLDWFLVALTTSLDGDNIWLIEMQDKRIQMSPEDYLTGKWQRYKSSLQLTVEGDKVQLLALNAERLLDIEIHSATLLSQRQDCKWMQGREAAQNFSHPTADAVTGRSQLYLRNPALQNKTKTPQTWVADSIKVRYLGLTVSRTELVTFVTGRLRKLNAKIQATTLNKSSSLAFDPVKGAFAFRIQTTLGESTLASTDSKLDRFGSLVHFLETTRPYGFELRELSLERLTFMYSLPVPAVDDSAMLLNGSDVFSASITFPDPSRMKISFSEGNPHLLIRQFLNDELNEANGLTNLANTLYSTLPLISSLRSIQEVHSLSDKFNVFVIPRSCTSFQVRYCNKTVTFRFEILLRCQGDLKIHITQAIATLRPGAVIPKKVDPVPNAVATGSDAMENQPKPLEPKDLQKVWEGLIRSRGNGWYNVGRGMICEPSSIDICLRYLDVAVSDAFSKAANPESEVSPPVKMEPADSNIGTPSTIIPLDSQKTAAESKTNATQTDMKKPPISASSSSSATTNMTVSNAQSAPKTVSTDSPGPPRPEGAPQAPMQTNRASPGDAQIPAQTRAVNMNFRPGIGQQMPNANAMAMLQAQQRLAQSSGAPQANMAQVRPGMAGQPRVAPQANMQVNMQNRRPPAANATPPKPSPGQTKNQPITLE